MIKDKTYYSISEVSEVIEVNQSTIRYWETCFYRSLRPKQKTKNKQKKYKVRDIQLLLEIRRELHLEERSVKEVQDHLKEYKPDGKYTTLLTDLEEKRLRTTTNDQISSSEKARLLIKKIRDRLNTIR